MPPVSGALLTITGSLALLADFSAFVRPLLELDELERLVRGLLVRDELDLLVVDLLDDDLLAVDLLVVLFFAVDFFAAGFLAADFLVVDLLVVVGSSEESLLSAVFRRLLFGFDLLFTI